MGTKPQVLLDIGFLGHGFDFPSHQRGVHRVISHIFDGLVASEEWDSSFVASSNLAGTADFLRSRGIDPATRLKSGAGQLSRSRISQAITKYIFRTVHDRSLPARVSRKLLAQVDRWMNHGLDRLTSRQLEGVDIYHSPHAALPEIVQQHATVRPFITIHDMLTVTNPEYFGPQAAPYAKKLVSCLTERTYAFCVSSYSRSEALRISRLRPENVFVTPLAADRENFFPVTDAQKIAEARKIYGIPEGPYFLALSAHDRHKNFDHLIDCLVDLDSAKELKEINLVIAGPNPQRRSIVQDVLARYPALEGRIIVTGYLANEHLSAIYSGATAFLFPSLAEGFGIPPLEAMQCGTPVIASNTSSIPEVVGDAGILLPPQDRDAWCQAMISLARNNSMRAELSQKSIARAATFSWDRFVDQTNRGYKASMER